MIGRGTVARVARGKDNQTEGHGDRTTQRVCVCLSVCPPTDWMCHKPLAFVDLTFVSDSRRSGFRGRKVKLNVTIHIQS